MKYVPTYIKMVLEAVGIDNAHRPLDLVTKK
jgi:hypothetical protein